MASLDDRAPGEPGRILRPFHGRAAQRSVLLINPPDPALVSVNRDAAGGYGLPTVKSSRPNYPPMDFLYAATCLTQAGVRLKIFDTLGQPHDLRQLRPEEYQIIAVRTTYTTFLNDLDFVGELVAASPRSAIYLFGPYLNTPSPADRERAAGRCGWIAGDPEIPLLRLAFGEDPRAVAGVFPDPRPAAGEGERARGPGAGPPSVAPFFNEDLDGLPYPDWSLISLRDYSLEAITGENEPAYSVLTSRGCPYHCHYCAYPLGQGRRVRFRSVENVAGELDQLVTRHDARQVIFRDPLFSASQGRTRRILAALRELAARHGRPLQWIAESRPDHLSRELLEEMARSGCTGINLGVETLSAEVSRRNGRKVVPAERIASLVADCRELRINAYLFLLLGLPGETRASVRETVTFLKEARPHFFNFFQVIPYPGTRLAARAEENGWTYLEEAQYALHGRVSWARNEFLDLADLNGLIEEALRELYAHKARWLLDHPRQATAAEWVATLRSHAFRLFEQRRYAEIPAFLDPLLEGQDPVPEGTFLQRAIALFVQGKWKDALRDLAEEMRRFGETEAALIYQVRAFERLGRRPEVEVSLQRLGALAGPTTVEQYRRERGLGEFAGQIPPTPAPGSEGEQGPAGRAAGRANGDDPPENAGRQGNGGAGNF